MPGPHTLLTGLVVGESPRWHDGRLWFANWGAQEIVAADLQGNSEVIAHSPTPVGYSIDWLPDGRLLVTGQELLRREPDGSLVTHADLRGLSDRPWNEIVVDGRGNAYLNNIGFDFPAGAFAPGIVALVTPDGSARQVADGLAFPNGMVVTQPVAGLHRGGDARSPQVPVDAPGPGTCASYLAARAQERAAHRATPGNRPAP
jgi:sugar lactone lactonase YvrE